MSEPLTLDDAELIWSAITDATIDAGNTAAQSLLHRAVDAAGRSTHAACANLVKQDYAFRDGVGAPDFALTVSILADALISDLTGQDAKNDRHLLNDRDAFGHNAARRRQDYRAVLRTTLTGMERDDFRALVDRLAGMPSVQAA